MSVIELPSGIRDRIAALNAQLEQERQKAAHAGDLLDRIFTAPDVDAIFEAIEEAEDEWAAVVRRGA